MRRTQRRSEKSALGAQASYLKTLCQQAGCVDKFRDNLTKAEASKMIDEMREKADIK